MLHVRKVLTAGALLAITLTPSVAHADVSPGQAPAPSQASSPALSSTVSPGSFDAVLAPDEDLILLAGWLDAYDELPLAAAVHLETTFGDLRGRLLTARAAAGTAGLVVPSGTAPLRSALADAQARLTGIRVSVAASSTIPRDARGQLGASLDGLASALDARLAQPSALAPASIDALLAPDEQLLELVGTLHSQGQLTLADTLLTLEQPLADLRGDLVLARAVASATGPFSATPGSLASVLEGAQKALADADAYVVADQTLLDGVRSEFRPRIAALATALAGLVTQAAGASGTSQSQPQCDGAFCFSVDGP